MNSFKLTSKLFLLSGILACVTPELAGACGHHKADRHSHHSESSCGMKSAVAFVAGVAVAKLLTPAPVVPAPVVPATPAAVSVDFVAPGFTLTRNEQGNHTFEPLTQPGEGLAFVVETTPATLPRHFIPLSNTDGSKAYYPNWIAAKQSFAPGQYKCGVFVTNHYVPANTADIKSTTTFDNLVLPYTFSVTADNDQIVVPVKPTV